MILSKPCRPHRRQPVTSATRCSSARSCGTRGYRRWRHRALAPAAPHALLASATSPPLGRPPLPRRRTAGAATHRATWDRAGRPRAAASTAAGPGKTTRPARCPLHVPPPTRQPWRPRTACFGPGGTAPSPERRRTPARRPISGAWDVESATCFGPRRRTVAAGRARTCGPSPAVPTRRGAAASELIRRVWVTLVRPCSRAREWRSEVIEIGLWSIYH
jgi:hypothetical protein